MNYIFDFDGTICDSFAVVLATANKYLTQNNKKPITAKDIRTKGIEKLIKEYKLSKLQTLIFVYKGRKEFKKFKSGLKIFPGLSSILEEISTTNTLVILSSNSKENIYEILKKNKILHLFKFIETNPFLFNKGKKLKEIIKKEKLNPKEVIYFGDEIRDIRAGKVANVKTAAVTWGYEGEKLLKSTNPDFLISSPRELLQVGK